MNRKEIDGQIEKINKAIAESNDKAEVMDLDIERDALEEMRGD